MDVIERIFCQAIDPERLRINPNDPKYTIPHTRDTYEVGAPYSGATGERFRKGNHPVRVQELRRKFREVEVVALFPEEQSAIKLKRLLNEQSSR
jgi:hypothetical protein